MDNNQPFDLPEVPAAFDRGAWEQGYIEAIANAMRVPHYYFMSRKELLAYRDELIERQKAYGELLAWFEKFVAEAKAEAKGGDNE